MSVLIVLGLGLISHIVSQEKSKREIFYILGRVYIIVSIELLGFVAWAHHILFILVINEDTLAYFTFATMVVAILTGVKVFK